MKPHTRVDYSVKLLPSQWYDQDEHYMINWHSYPELHDVDEGLIETVQAIQNDWLLLLYAAQMLLQKHGVMEEENKC